MRFGADVERDEVEWRVARVFERLKTVVDAFDSEAGEIEVKPNQLTDRGIVLDDQGPPRRSLL